MGSGVFFTSFQVNIGRKNGDEEHEKDSRPLFLSAVCYLEPPTISGQRLAIRFITAWRLVSPSRATIF